MADASNVTLTWLGDQVLAQITAQLTGGLTTFNEQLAGAARDKLYPGHGYLTGRLKGSIRPSATRASGAGIEGSVGAFGVEYSLIVHARYRYILDALDQLQGSAVRTISGR